MILSYFFSFLISFFFFFIKCTPSDLSSSFSPSDTSSNPNSTIGSSSSSNSGKKDVSYTNFLLGMLGGLGAGIRKIILDSEKVNFLFLF